jgi:dihydroanticapsin dehydrogenase
MLDLQVKGATVLITGGASGIGAACARAFAAQGAAVVVLDRDAASAAALAVALVSEGHEALAVAADVSDDGAMKTAVAQAAAWRDGLDVVLCCAGISGPVGQRVTETASADWARVMAVNLGGLFHAARHAMPWLEASPVASFVILASDSSFLAYPGMAAYSTAKGGALMFTRALAVDHPRVRVNCVCPSVVDTPMSRADLGLDEAQMARANFPVISPGQLANHVLFLASPISAPMNGAALVVDFGYMARPSFPQPDFV